MLIGASVSEPHTSELAGGFSICMLCRTYVIPYISMIYLSGTLSQVYCLLTLTPQCSTFT